MRNPMLKLRLGSRLIKPEFYQTGMNAVDARPKKCLSVHCTSSYSIQTHDAKHTPHTHTQVKSEEKDMHESKNPDP